MMSSLELNKMAPAPMTDFEMQEIDGGSFWGEIWKAVVVDIIVDGVKAVAGAMADDWNSRPGTPRTMTDAYASNPYH
ncbi:MAG TPA: hypothetical protein VF622_12460 [Segetibacter sp.]